jgi:4-amino-4-deoxy-L-arabinose transferase-like glycosyltransferase
VIRTPTVPTKPASPNRLGIILIGVLLSGALAFALAVIIDSSDPTVRGADDLQSILKVAPMAAVPAILNRSDIRVRRLGWAAVLGVYVAAGIAVAATIRLAA